MSSADKNKKANSSGSSWLRRISLCFFVLGVVTALVLGFLQYTPWARRVLFAKIQTNMAKHGRSPAMDALRCEVLANVTGKVLEIGPGSGTNFNCYARRQNQRQADGAAGEAQLGPDGRPVPPPKKQRGPISQWIGIEPNPNFEGPLQARAAEVGIDFPTTLMDGVAESLHMFADGSFDTVVSTHVFCSVADTQQALNEIVRVLKPGGALYFLEHIAAQRGRKLRTLQSVLAPVWRIIGDGCRFIDFSDYLEGMKGAGHLDVYYEEFEAPIGLFLVAPHVKGYIAKK